MRGLDSLAVVALAALSALGGCADDSGADRGPAALEGTAYGPGVTAGDTVAISTKRP